MSKLLKPREVSERLGVATATLRWWRMIGRGPQVVKIGPSSFRYPEEQLTRYIEENTVKSSLEASRVV